MVEKFNCGVCGCFITEEEGITTLNGLWVCDKDSCRTLDEENQATERKVKSPIGVMPRHLWDGQREHDLGTAILRYVGAGKKIPDEWIQEYFESEQKKGRK